MYVRALRTCVSIQPLLKIAHFFAATVMNEAIQLCAGGYTPFESLCSRVQAEACTPYAFT